jgi:hypothetical protein
MGLKRNLPFVIAMVAIGVIFVAAAVVVQRSYAGWTKTKQEDKATDQELDELKRKVPTPEHRDYTKDELKQSLLVWWDADVYNEDRTPGIFLGNLQELRRRIALFAASQKEPVLLAEGVPLMGFDELRSGTPPPEVTFDMLKQKSIMRDIILLLIQEKVYSINSIVWKGPEKGGKLYNKYVVTVSFTCRYPQLAKFQTDLVKTAKTQVVLRGERGERTESFELPRNFLVIEQLSYAADDLKIARLGAPTTPTGTTGTGTYPPGTGIYPPDSSHHLPGSGSMRQPNQPVSSAASVRPPGASSGPGSDPYSRRVRPPGATGASATTDRTVRSDRVEPEKEGREPLYNNLTVTMTISMVDFGEAIRGKLAVENEKKAGGTARSTVQPTGGQ